MLLNLMINLQLIIGIIKLSIKKQLKLCLIQKSLKHKFQNLKNNLVTLNPSNQIIN